MDRVPRIVVISGPPGAGKSAVAGALAARIERSVLIDGDAFFRSVRGGWIPPWQAEADHQNGTVIRAIGAAAEQFAAGGYTAVVDGVIGPWFLGAFLDQVENPVDYLILRPSAETALNRAIARDDPELVDPEPIAHMFRAFSELGEHERFVVDSTAMSIDQTTEAALLLIASDELSVRS